MPFGEEEMVSTIRGGRGQRERGEREGEREEREREGERAEREREETHKTSILSYSKLRYSNILLQASTELTGRSMNLLKSLTSISLSMSRSVIKISGFCPK